MELFGAPGISISLVAFTWSKGLETATFSELDCKLGFAEKHTVLSQICAV